MAFRRVKHRVVQLAELDLDVAFCGDLHRVAHRVWHLGEQRRHLLRRAQIKLLLHIAHAVRVREQRLRADADQRVVRVRVAFLDVVDIVGRHQFEPHVSGPRDELSIDLGLIGDAVVVQLEVVVLHAECLLEPVDLVARPVEFLRHDQPGNLAGQASAQADQPLAVLREQFLVDPRLVVVALKLSGGGQAHEVLVTGLVLGQEHEMVVRLLAARAGLFLVPAAGRDVHLAANDWLDVPGAGCAVKIDRAEHRPVVGDRERTEAQVARLVDQAVHTARAVEQ